MQLRKHIAPALKQRGLLLFPDFQVGDDVRSITVVCSGIDLSIFKHELAPQTDHALSQRALLPLQIFHIGLPGHRLPLVLHRTPGDLRAKPVEFQTLSQVIIEPGCVLKITVAAGCYVDHREVGMGKRTLRHANRHGLFNPGFQIVGAAIIELFRNASPEQIPNASAQTPTQRCANGAR